MATVFKRGEKWVAQWYSRSGKRVKRSTGTARKREAKRMADAWEAEDRKLRAEDEATARKFQIILERAAADANAGKLTLARAKEHLQSLHLAADPGFKVVSLREHLNAWCEEQQRRVSDSTASIYYDMKRRVIDALPATVVSAPVGELTRSDVEAAVRKIATSKSKGSRKHVRAATVNLVLRAFRRALSDAVDAGLSTSNPAKLVRTLPETDSTEKAPFTLAEVQAMLSHPDTSDEWRGMITIGAHTGMRMGDIASLTAGHIEDGRIVIRPKKTSRSRKVVVVPLTSACISWIGERSGALFPELSPMPASSRSTEFARIMKRAGVDREAMLPGQVPARRSFHSLRHTFTSWLAESSTPADVRQRLTGHRSPGIHARYTHHDRTLDAAVSSLPDLPTQINSAPAS